MYYYVPVAEQVDNNNPMVLLDDAPLGEWSYEWYEDNGDDLIAEGTFMVEDSNEAVVNAKIDDLNNQLTTLQDSVSDVTAEFDDVRSDISDVAAIAEQAVSAANTAAEAIQTVAQTANTASQAAENAADAANAAKDAASGLTTLVYGAIGASLVAALAAIVSLMQISRRIAG
jgi:methyl-accepting chemotaxis protein